MREIQAQTFTPQYDSLEDRIRLVINYQDIHNRCDLMITRSFIINIYLSIDNFLLQHYGNGEQLVNKISIDTDIKNQTNTHNPMEPTDNSNLQLLKQEDELLLKIDLSYQPNTKHTILTLSSSKTVATAILNEDMIRALFDSIKSAIPKFNWGLSPTF